MKWMVSVNKSISQWNWLPYLVCFRRWITADATFGVRGVKCTNWLKELKENFCSAVCFYSKNQPFLLFWRRFSSVIKHNKATFFFFCHLERIKVTILREGLKYYAGGGWEMSERIWLMGRFILILFFLLNVKCWHLGFLWVFPFKLLRSSDCVIVGSHERRGCALSKEEVWLLWMNSFNSLK